MIGENISFIRRERGYTQEQLARGVGVSAQAVSKWENGGTPDAELLPAVADYLGVTVDSLFGRGYKQNESMESIMTRWLADMPSSERMKRTFALLSRIFERMYHFGGPGLSELMSAVCETLPFKSCYSQNLLDEAGTLWLRSQIQTDQGMQLGVLAEDFPLYVLLLKPEQGYAANFAANDEYRKLFSTLAMPGALELLCCLYSRELNYFSAAAAANYAGVSREEAEAALEAMTKCGLTGKKQVELEQGLVEVYEIHDNGAFVPFMYLTRWFMEDNDAWAMCWHDRTHPVLAAPEKEERA